MLFLESEREKRCECERGKIVSPYAFVTRQPIDKGWSNDKKYRVTDEQGNTFLLRVSPMEQYDGKKSEYDLMRRVAALGVPTCPQE